MINEQHAIDMVDLMLEAGGEQAVGLDLLMGSHTVLIADLHPRWALDDFIIFRDRKTPLLVVRLIVGRPEDLRVHEEHGRGRFVLLGEIHHHDAQGLGDLDGGEANARRVIHGLEHVIHQGADGIVHHFDSLGHEAQTWVGNADDGSQGHGSLKGSRALVEGCFSRTEISMRGARVNFPDANSQGPDIGGARRAV